MLFLSPGHWVLGLTWKEEDVSADQVGQRAKESGDEAAEREGRAVGWMEEQGHGRM